MQRSFWPRKRMSTPGTAAISAIFSMQDAVSTCRATMPSLFHVAGVAEESGFVHAALWEVDGARADRGILRATDGFAGFFGSIDVGDEDAVGSHVESLLDAGAVVVSADADQRLGAAVGDAAEHGGELFIAHGAMLGVDQQPVVSAVRELFGDGGAVGVEEQAHLWAVRREVAS